MMVDFNHLFRFAKMTEAERDAARKDEARIVNERVVRELAESVLAQPTEIDKWLELFDGQCAVHEVQELLNEQDLWSVTGLRYIQQPSLRFTLCVVSDYAAFDTWLTEHRPAILDAFHAADAIRLLRKNSESVESAI